MDSELQIQIQTMIDSSIDRSFAFPSKKIGDTPTDAYQLTPKKYVDSQISSIAQLSVWGDASDSSATLNGSSVVGFASIVASNTYNLTRDAYLNSFTVNSGVTVRTNSYRIFAQTLVSNAGTIHNNGYAGGDATVGNAGGGGSVVGAASLGSSGAGSIGGTPTNAQNVANSWGGTGGGGGNGGGNPGSVAAALTRPIFPSFAAVPVDLSLGSIMAVRGGSGGGGGKFGSIGNNQGGGGGGGGGVVLIASPTITNTGSITANGANGGNGVYSSDTQGGGGGGGGGGGAVFLFYKNLTAGTITVSGGNGGLGASPGGVSGTAGASGTIYEFKAST